MTYLPSHNNSANERTERRQNWKNDMRQSADAKQPLMTTEAAKIKFTRLATALIAAGSITTTGNQTRVYVKGGTKFFPVYKIGNSFSCECADAEKYGFCAHKIAAAMCAAIETAAPVESEPEMICLSHRADEFASALKRAADSQIEVFADFERDAFIAKNHANGSEYRVVLKTINGELFTSCECADFQNRKRICKHALSVIQFTHGGVAAIFAAAKPAVNKQPCGCKFNFDDKFWDYCDAHYTEKLSYERDYEYLNA